MPRHLTRLAVLAIVAAAVLPYARVTTDYFIQDDFGVVALLSGKPAAYFPRWFVSTWMDDIWGYTPDEIRPFPALTYQIAATWGAASPVANHVINIALHAVNALLVFAVAREAAGLAAPGAFVAAVAFAWLPMQAESVAWITGRVDSIPACFYLAAFLLFVRWRTTGARAPYVGAVLCCFVALFSKQNTITLPAALVAYDVIVGRAEFRPIWRAARPYLPFVLLTAGYLLLRWMLFGEVAREGLLTAGRLDGVLLDLSVHLKRMIYGEAGVALPALRVFAAAGAVVAVTAVLAVRLRVRDHDRDLRSLGAAAFYFLVVWIALGAAPTLVAGYASPRHMYLASVGWAIGIGLAVEALRLTERRWLTATAAAAVVLILGVYLVQLNAVIDSWRMRAAVSEHAVRAVQREALAAAEGTLIVAGIPRSSWDFAVPHALRPPFTAADLTQRVSVITHSSLHCCPANVWEPHTRRLLHGWRVRAVRPPVIALHWNPQIGGFVRLTDADDPQLRSVMELLPDLSQAALDEAILDTFAELVTPNGRPVPAN